MRKYIFNILKNDLEIYFYETPKLLFQSIQLKNNDGILHGIASHQCIEDCYTSNYIFKPNLEFEIIHNVTGPRKIIEFSFQVIINLSEFWRQTIKFLIIRELL